MTEMIKVDFCNHRNCWICTFASKCSISALQYYFKNKGDVE